MAVAPLRAQFAFLGGVTAASLAAQPGPTNAADQPCCYIDEFDAWYRWIPGSAVAADGFRVISHTGGTAGRWILDGDHITLAPRGGVLDDWARLIGGACAAMAGFGEVHCLNTGPLVPFRVATNQITPSNTTLRLNGATFVSTLVDNSPVTFDGSIFFAFGDRVVVTTIAVNAAAGATAVTLTSAAAFAIGDRILFQQGTAYWTQRVIKNKVGDVVTLDRPLFRPFVAGSNTLTLGVGGQNIRIYGGGATFTGTGTAVVEFLCAKDCYIEGINASVTTRFGFCWDVGCRDSTFKDCSIDNNNTALTSGYLVALSEQCDLIDCDGYRAGAISVYLSSSDNCRIIRGTYSESGGNGLLATVDDVTDTIGNQGCLIEGSVFTKAVLAGVAVFGAGRTFTFVGVVSSFNLNGFTFQSAAGGTVADCVVLGGQVVGNTGVGNIANAAVRIKIIGQASDGVECCECNNAGELELVGVSITDTSTAAVAAGLCVANGAGTILRISACIGFSTRNIEHFVRIEANAKVFIDGPTRYQSTGANCVGVIIDAGVARVSGFVVVSAGGIASGVYLNGATAYARIADDCDFSATTTPLANPGGGAFNRSLVPIALNGAVPVALAFGDTNAQDRCFTTLVAAGGVPTGQIFTGAPVVGTGFNVVGVAGDTSTFHYEIR